MTTRVGSFLPAEYKDDAPLDVAVVPDRKLAKLCAEYAFFSNPDVDNHPYRIVEENIARITEEFMYHFALTGWCFVLQANNLVAKHELTYWY